MTPILAIAWKFLRELARRRSTYVFLLLVAACAAGLPFLDAADGAAGIRFRLVVSYGIAFPVFLLGVATIFLATCIARDVENRRILLTIAKPVGALRLLAGSLLGILIADACALLVVLAAFAANVAMISRAGSAGGEDRLASLGRILLPREPFSPVVPPPSAPAVNEWVTLEAERGRAAGREANEASLELQARRALRLARIPPGESAELEWTIPGAAASRLSGPEEVLLRFEVYSSSPREAPRVDVAWEIVSRGEAAGVVVAKDALQGVPQEVTLPALAAGENGALKLRARNVAPPGSGLSLVIDPARVELLVSYGRFWPNVARAFLLILAQLALLASLVLAVSCVFSSPTVLLLGLFLFVTALSAGFLRETLDIGGFARMTGGWAGTVEAWTSAYGRAFLRVLPDFTTTDPIASVADARALTPADLLREAGWSCGLKGLAVLGVGAWFLGRRELAGGARP